MNVSASLVALGQSIPVLAIQSTLLLWLALGAGFLLRKRGAAAQVVVYRAALVGVLALGVLFLTGVRKYSGLTRFPAPDAGIAIPLPFARAESARVEGATVEPAPGAAASPSAAQTLPAVTRTDAVAIGSVTGLAGTVWIAVSGVILLWTFGCHALLLRLLRRCTPVEDTEAKALLSALCSQMNVRPPLLLTGPWVRGSFLNGLTRPAILLPRNFRADFPGEALWAVLTHELVHLARRDCWWNLASRTICALGWMQPLLWLLHHRLEQASEEACDQEVLHHGLSAQEYARCLTDLAERLLPTVPARVAGASVLPLRSGLGRRVERILKHAGARPVPSGRLRIGVWGGAAVAVSMVTGLVSLMPASAGAQEEPPKGNLMGKVVHQDGRPAQKMKLVALQTPQPARWSPGTLEFALTDAQGNYRFRGLNAGDFSVLLVQPSDQWAAAAVRAVVPEGEPGSAPEIVLRPGALIRGRVVDKAGQPVVGVYVTSAGPDRPDFKIPFGTLKTDASGRFQLRVSPGKSAFWVIGPVDRTAVPGQPDPPVVKVEVEVASGDTRDLEIRTDGKRYAGGVITGRVVLPDGKPAAGIRVMAQLNDDYHPSNEGRTDEGAFSWSEAISGPDGTYRLTGLMTAPYNVAVQDPSGQWVAAAKEHVAAVQRRTVSPSALVLTPGGFVTGTVTDEATGKPLPGVSIGSYGPHRPRSSAMIISTQTDASGRYRFRVAPGESYVYVQDPRHGQGLNANLTLAEGETRDLPFRVKAVPPKVE